MESTKILRGKAPRWSVVLAVLLTGCSDDAVTPDVAVGTDLGTWDATVDVTGTPDQTLPDLSSDASVSDLAADASQIDATTAVDASQIDTAVPVDATTAVDASVDAGTAFPAVLEGIWLIGWSGGMNHFSWVRITGAASGGGQADILDGAGLSINVPFWNCTGTGSWNITAKPDTIQIHFPSSLCNGMKSSSYTFSSFGPPGSYPTGAVLQAIVTSAQPPGTSLSGYKFPPSQCNAAMTSCTDPL